EFPVVHAGQTVVIYANGVSLSPAAMDLTGANVKVVTPRSENDIIRIVLLSAGATFAAGIQGENDAANATYYGKDDLGNIGFHPLALTKLAEPINYVATEGQTTFAAAHDGINNVEVFVDGVLKHSGFTAPAGQIVFDVGLTAGQQVRINLLKAPRSNGDLLVGNYARVAYEVYSSGGTFIKNGWRIRALNKIVQDNIGISLNSNRIILPAGIYYVKGYAACVGVRQNVLRMFNQTTNEELLIGPAVFAAQITSVRNQTMECHTPIDGYITLNTQSAIVLQHRGVVTVNGFGFGRGSAGGLDAGSLSTYDANILGYPGRLVDLEIWKVS
ncbi:MAG TPA: hypothetical protein VLA40_12225, partial [Rheinheimera sp.]|nr:hypothetical protein [Rheinheimera sp.]